MSSMYYFLSRIVACQGKYDKTGGGGNNVANVLFVKRLQLHYNNIIKFDTYFFFN